MIKQRLISIIEDALLALKEIGAINQGQLSEVTRCLHSKLKENQ